MGLAGCIDSNGSHRWRERNRRPRLVGLKMPLLSWRLERRGFWCLAIRVVLFRPEG
jgi:hypothetical protein